MLNVTINAEGKTLSDLLDAVGEAVTRLDNEFTSGHDRNESSSFTFERDGEEECTDPMHHVNVGLLGTGHGKLC